MKMYTMSPAAGWFLSVQGHKVFQSQTDTSCTEALLCSSQYWMMSLLFPVMCVFPALKRDVHQLATSKQVKVSIRHLSETHWTTRRKCHNKKNIYTSLIMQRYQRRWCHKITNICIWPIAFQLRQIILFFNYLSIIWLENDMKHIKKFSTCGFPLVWGAGGTS